MKSHNIEEVDGVKITKLKPKTVLRKKPSEKKRDAVELFKEVGIPDPNQFWDELMSTQKPKIQDDEEKENSS